MEFSVKLGLVSEKLEHWGKALEEKWRVLSLLYEKRDSAGNAASNSISGDAEDTRVPIHMLLARLITRPQCLRPSQLSLLSDVHMNRTIEILL